MASEDIKLQGVKASNQQFRKYEGVDKKQDYKLSEGKSDSAEQFDDEFTIRTVDLSKFLNGNDKDKAEFAKDLGESLEEIGFAVLQNHGVDASILQAADKMVKNVFERPVEEKLKFDASRVGSINQGYFPIKNTSNIHPDLVEGWVFCRRAFDLPSRDRQESTKFVSDDFWPEKEHELFFRNYVIEMEKLILPIIQSMLMHLKADPHSYDKKLTQTNIGLRLNYYPPVSEEDDKLGAGRLLGHEDVTMFTLLPAPSIEGLQVLNRKNNKWIRLSPPPGTIILNTGDYMQRITNDVFSSTTHRVSKPRDTDLRRSTRTSFPVNVYLWEDEMLEVLPSLKNPKYPKIKAIEFHTGITAKYYGDAYKVNN